MKQDYSLTVIGTLRKNKSEIPPPFTKCAPAGTSWFAYADFMTLVSYCRKKKVVLLVSTYHKTERIDDETKKPEIMIFYNKTNGGTDNFDQLCRNYTTSHITKCWPLRISYGMLDQADINSAILYCLRIENEALSRHDFLKQLAIHSVSQI